MGLQALEIEDYILDDSSSDVAVVSGGNGDTYLTLKFKKKAKSLSNKDGRIKLKVETDSSSNIITCYATGGHSGSLWQRTSSDPDSIFYQGNNVGVGTDTPQTKLEVNGAVKLGNTSLPCDANTEGSLKNDGGLFFCSSNVWRRVRLEGPFVWVNVSATGEAHNTTCSNAGYTVALDQGYGICASGERRPTEGDDATKINYFGGIWAGPGVGGTIIAGNYCYGPGQPHDNDGSDVTVAWLCQRYQLAAFST